MTDLSISQLPQQESDLTGEELVEISKLSSTVTITSSTINADSSNNSFNDTAFGFIDAGFGIGDRVNITGFANASNNIFSAVITTLTAGSMIIGGVDGDVIVNEAAGNSVTISKWVSRRISLTHTNSNAELRLPIPTVSEFPISIGSPVTNEIPNRGFSMTGPPNTLTIRALMKSPPSGNFSVKSRVRGHWGNNFNLVGNIFRDSANRFAIGALVAVDGALTEIACFSNDTTFFQGQAVLSLGSSNFPEWIRTDYNSSTNILENFVSWDGVFWRSTGTSNFLGAIDAFGLAVVSRNSVVPVWATFTGFEVTQI